MVSRLPISSCSGSRHGPAWCFEFSSSRCSGSVKNLRLGAHAHIRSVPTQGITSCRAIGTAIHHNLSRRREALIHSDLTPPNPPTFSAADGIVRFRGGIYQGITQVTISEFWGQHSSNYEVGRSLCSQRVPSENCTARSMGMFIAMRTVG